MPSRKTWSQLKPDTKKRKLAWFAKHQGLSPAQVRTRYNSGKLDLVGSRGHANTPEHPERAYKDSGQYDDYRSRKTAAINRITAWKERKFGSRPRFNAKRSRKSARYDSENREWGVKDLQTIEAMIELADEEDLDWAEIIDMDDDYESAFYYK